MKIAIMQPYLFPYLGYFQLINSVDVFIIYDDVNYIKGGWINRNNILLNGKKHLWTLPLVAPSPFKSIQGLKIHDFLKTKKSLLALHQNAYRKAPYFSKIFPLLEEILSNDEDDLVSIIQHSLKVLCTYLDIKTKIILSSSLEKDMSLPAEARLIQMVKNNNGNVYINSIGGQELYSKENWLKEGLDLMFLKSSLPTYSQSTDQFVAGLSIIDVLMNNSQEASRELLDAYEFQ